MGHFFINRPVMAIVIAIVTVLGGVVALTRLPIAQFPEIVPPQIQVNTTYTGADAVTVEQSVATPLEQQINGVEHMLYVKSNNANDGTLSIEVTFDVGTNIDIANVLTQNRVSQAQPSLPVDVKQYGVNVEKSLSFPLMVVALYSPKADFDSSFLGNYSNININDELKRISGVGKVSIFGSADYAMRVWVKPDRLAKLGLTVSDLQRAIQTQNTVNPAGKMGGEPVPPGQEFTYAMRAQGRLIQSEDFESVVVRENPDGSVVRIKDIGRVELGTQTYDQRGRFNGKPAALVLVYQSPGSNALDVAKGVREAMQKVSPKFPSGVDYAIALDTTAPITEGIKEVLHTLFEAVVLVILVVFIFLQGWRATLIPLLTVPVALIGTFIFFPMLGFTINTLTLFALVLAIGLVVDDAIVVVEAVEHHIEKGLSPIEATRRAMTEVSGPVVAIALVLSAVFVPVAFMGGMTGRMFQQFAVTIAISVMISAFNALSLSPALCAIILRPKDKNRKGLVQKFYDLFNRGFGASTDKYVQWTTIFVRKLVIAGLLLGIVTLGAGGLGSAIKKGFVPEEDAGYFYVNVQLPAAASLQRTDAAARKVEKAIASTYGVEDVSTVGGYSLINQSSASYYAFFFVKLKNWEERNDPSLHAKALTDLLNQKLREIPEVNAVAFGPPAVPGIGNSGGFSFMVQDRGSSSPAELEKQTKAFIAEARKRPEIGSAFTLFRADVPQIFAKVDRDRVLKLGVPVEDLYRTLQVFLGSAYLSDFTRFGRQWKVYLGSEGEYRRDIVQLENFLVRNKEGKMVPMSALVEPEPVNGPEKTVRFNLYRSAEVMGSPAPGYSSGQALDALEDVAKKVLPSNFGYAFNAMSFQEKKAPSAVPTFALAILFVFLILAAQYESWSLPFAVMLATPTAVVGAMGGLMFRDLEFNLFAQIGLVMLIGLTAKNSILIVEFAELEYRKGQPLLESALTAARLRLRPILMTAFAFILGCIPLAISGGAGAASRQNMGTVIVFGALVATFAGIFFTPALFITVRKLFPLKESEKKEVKSP